MQFTLIAICVFSLAMSLYCLYVVDTLLKTVSMQTSLIDKGFHNWQNQLTINTVLLKHGPYGKAYKEYVDSSQDKTSVQGIHQTLESQCRGPRPE